MVLSLSSSNSNSWILDTGCSTHICNSLQALQNLRVLKKGDFKLYGARGESIQAKVVGTYILKLPFGRILELDNRYYMPKIVRNIIFISLLLQRGFEINGKGMRCSISFSNKFYYDGIFDNGFLVLCLNNSMFQIDKKHKRDEINETLLWHCQLGHISETRVQKLYKDDFFGPYDYESLETCKSYLIKKNDQDSIQWIWRKDK